MEDLGLFSIPNTHSHEFVAKSNGQAYQVWVATPSKPVPGQPFKVLYVLDGNWSFGTAVETVRMLGLGGEVPPLLVVGVGYPGPRGYRDSGQLRNFELSPTDDLAYRERASRQGQPVGERGLGGAPGFLQFLTDELAPFVEERYNGDPADRCLFGYSLGGLFATHALLQEPPKFQRLVIGSPSLWWNDRVMFEHEEQRAAGSKAMPAKVFFSAGAQEEAPGSGEAATFGMVSNTVRFAAMLASRGYEGLRVTSHVFPDEAHHMPPMLVRGLRAVYRD